MIRVHLFPFSLLIYKQKEVWMWKWIKTTMLMEGVVDSLNITGNIRCSFVFILSISVLQLLKRHLWIPVKIKKKGDVLWLDSEISVEEVWLFFFTSLVSNVSWFIASGTYPFGRGSFELHYRKPLNSTYENIIWKSVLGNMDSKCKCFLFSS